ncbi:MAG: type II secretion system protein [Gammaproteobacteria bacterium]
MATAVARKGDACGFTLVELLIVVVILAILAAVAVPQFTRSTDDAKVSALDSTLSRMRSAIDLYYQQHGHYPGSVTAAGATCTGGTAGTGTAADAAERALALGSQLTMYTNAAGQACSIKGTDFRFGPYLKTAGFGATALPKNPVTDSNAVAVVGTGDLNMTSASTTGGWKYDIVTGKFIADHSSYHDR